MTTLVFDTETSGFHDNRLPASHPQQGRILQIACILFDNEFKPINSFYSLVKPSGNYNIHSGAQDAHGISKDIVEKYGIESQHMLHIFESFYKAADMRVAHNLKFDASMIDNECATFDDNKNTFDWLSSSHVCTMQEMTDICKLPGGKFGSKYKWPKLQEAYKEIYGSQFDDAHDALADVTATGKIFAWLVQQNLVIPSSSLAV